jgi:FLVCR family MFS transporter 7
MAASLLLLGGNWLRYVGAKLAIFEVVMTGQVLIGMAQPFVLAAPTRFSDQWFTDKGRTTATAIASLANPFGGALGQLLAPIWVPTGATSKIPDMVLYVAIISSIAAIPSFFIPDHPPTPPSASARAEKTPLTKSLQQLAGNGRFYLIYIAFAIYVGFFNAVSSLLSQILTPYGFSETQAGKLNYLHYLDSDP